MASGRQPVRAMVLERPGVLVERSLDVPTVGEDDGLLRVEACGLCGTDHELFSGVLRPGFSFIPGHEAVGVVEELGSAAAARWGVQRGDRVAVEVFKSCRQCDPCTAGAYQRCARHGLADMYGFTQVDRAPGLWGGYAELLYLAPDAMLLPVPAGLDPVLATCFNPLGAGIRWAVSLPGTKPGDVVAVLGPGIRGLSACAAAREAGAATILITGKGPADRPRLEAAKDFGADLTVDVAEGDPVRVLNDATGGLADVVVDVTAKSPHALGQAVALARPGGTVVVAGTRGSSETPGFVPDDIVFKELRLLGALGVDSLAYRAALKVLVEGRYPFSDLDRRVVDLEGSESLLRSMAGEGNATPPIHAVVVP